MDPAWCRPPPRLVAAREYLDDDHASARAGAWARQHTRGIRRNILPLLRVGSRRGDIEECASRRDALGAVGGGKEPVVADAVETPWQHVDQEAPDEIVRVKPHRLPAAPAAKPVSLPPESKRPPVG